MPSTTSAAKWPPKGVAKPAARALASAGVKSLRDLSRLSEAELSGLHGMGPKAIGILKGALKAEGLTLKK